MKIYLDFDGTVVEHNYPKMGRCNFGSIEIIKKLQDAGHEIILNTYRADCNNGTLEEALRLLNENYWMVLKDRRNNQDFEMLPITKHCKEKIHPDAFDWKQIKETGVMFIDDQATNTPLKKAVMCNNMMVDWDELDRQFIENGVY
jgi:hypothetical protein